MDTAVPACQVCGGTVGQDGFCTRCGARADGSAAPTPRGELLREEAIRVFSGVQGIGESDAAVLFERGYTSLESLRDAPVAKLVEIPGFDNAKAESLRTGAAALLGASPPPGNDALRRWLAGESENGLATWLGGESTNGDTMVKIKDAGTEALRKWLVGDERSLDEWVGTDSTSALPSVFELPPQQTAPTPAAPGATPATAVSLPEDVVALRAELAAYLDKVKSGSIDYTKIIEENAALKEHSRQAEKKATDFKEEIQHIKKGSIAVIKYVKAQQAKAGSAEMKKQLTTEANSRRKVEIQLKSTQDLVATLQTKLQSGKSGDKKEVAKREAELAQKEAELNAQREEMKALQAAAGKGEIDIGGTGASVELQQRLSEELRQREEEFSKKEAELRKHAADAEAELGKIKIELKQRDESASLAGKSSGEVNSILAKKESEMLQKEKSILIREQEIERLKDELKFKEEEWKRAAEPLKYKEEEMTRREQEVDYQLKRVDAEKRKLEEAKAAGGSTEELEMKQRLEQLKGEITMKEEEVRNKEKYLKSKMEELRLREQGLVEEEIDARDEERETEVAREKIKTGIARLDDLLLGGIPFGSNVMVIGPPFAGKEVVVNLFMAEGLQKGIPVVWVLTDKAPADLREEMVFVLPSYEQYEKMGLVRYVDAYSRSMGAEGDEPNTIYVNEQTDHDGILKAVDAVGKELKSKHKYYRLAFRSVSTLIAYLDTSTAFKFLQPLAGRRKREKAVAMFVIEKGMHEEQDIQMIGSVMDGSVEFKLEHLKTYLQVKGIGDVQSRAWIEYTHNKSNVTVRSFSLGMIK